MTEPTTTYLCSVCGWVYDPEQGDPDGGRQNAGILTLAGFRRQCLGDGADIADRHPLFEKVLQHLE